MDNTRALIIELLKYVKDDKKLKQIYDYIAHIATK